MKKEKIKKLRDLAPILDELKRLGKRIVLCNGSFDIIHVGHIKHLESAKNQGDVLVVSVTPDKFISKGSGRPLFNEELRLESLAAIQDVDYVALNEWQSAIETINLLKPDVYVKGKDVNDKDELKKSNFELEKNAVNYLGGRVYMTDEKSFSSSKIINETNTILSADSIKYLEKIKNNYNLDEILSVIDSVRDLRVLIIGDTILDEYTDCKQMEKASKEAFVAYMYLKTEVQTGGILAIANHVAGFCDNVSLITTIGDDHKDFISGKLDKKINQHLIVQNGKFTLNKRRFIDQYRRNKLFEVYSTDNFEVDSDSEKRILEILDEELKKCDLVLVGDFGHGIMTENIRKKLIESDKFLAINTQLNSGNLGYNFITKYNRADYVLLNDREIRLPFQEKSSDIRVPINKLYDYVKADKINITLGKAGCIYFEKGEFYPVPALTEQVIDTMGSGDSVLSLTSLLACKKVSPYLLPFIGNCVGAISVKIIGNRNSVDPQDLKKLISNLMK